jgi:hypothetical protein
MHARLVHSVTGIQLFSTIIVVLFSALLVIQPHGVTGVPAFSFSFSLLFYSPQLGWQRLKPDEGRVECVSAQSISCYFISLHDNKP